VLRQGKLWVNGGAPLEPIGEGVFRSGGEASSPDVMEFLEISSGKALLLKTNGTDRWRVEVP